MRNLLIITLYLSIISIDAVKFPVNKPRQVEEVIGTHLNETKEDARTVQKHEYAPLNNSDNSENNEDTADDDQDASFRSSHNSRRSSSILDSHRFVQTVIDDIKEARQKKKSAELHRDENLAKAAKKRRIAEFLRQAAVRARDARLALAASPDPQNRTFTEEGRPELTNEEFQEVSNIRRAKVLEFEARLLEGQSRRYAKLAEGAKLDVTGFPVCDMVKVGPLEFVPTLDEIRQRIDHTVMGQLNGKTLSIYQKKRPKLTYELRSIQLPIFNVADSGENCWGFSYHEVDQVFCCVNEISRNSWIDALSEAWFCNNEGLQGLLPSVNATEEEMVTKKKVEKPTPPPKEGEPESLVDIDMGLDSEGNPKLTVNGKDIAKKAFGK